MICGAQNVITTRTVLFAMSVTSSERMHFDIIVGKWLNQVFTSMSIVFILDRRAIMTRGMNEKSVLLYSCIAT